MSVSGQPVAAGGPQPWAESARSSPSGIPGAGAAAGAYPTSPMLTLGSLFLSLIGFLGVALVLYEYKFQGVTVSWDGFPTRVLFVVSLALAAAPFFVTVIRRVPLPALILPVFLIMMIYPLFSPFGLPYSRDPVYNFQFSQAILSSGSWSPTHGVTGQAVTYSYYPGGAIFNALVPQLTGLTLFQTFNWSYELFRLLVVPLAVFALTARLFSARAAPLAVLLYISIPSIELNIPTQQDFAVTWFLLAVTVLAFLVTSSAADSLFLRLMVIAASVMVVLSHHISTYFLLAFVVGIAALPWILKRKDPYPNLRAPVVALRTIAIVLIWVALVTLPVIQNQSTIFLANAQAVFHPGVASAAATVVPGSSFPTYQLIWIGFAIAALAIAGLMVLVEKYREDDSAFVSFALITSFLIAIISIPFVSTGFNFLALRELEFIGVILAPAAAWYLVERVAYGHLLPSARRPSAPAARPNAIPAVARHHKAWPVALAGILVLVIVTGGYLVPLSTRDQFASPQGVLVDSPNYINPNAMAAVNWASAYVSRDHAIWGDELAYTVYGGFGHFKTVYDSYPLFEGPTFSQDAVNRLHRGDLVVVDYYMTQPHLLPVFPGPLSDQPPGFVPAAYLDKFSNPTYFAPLYQNSIFTLYEVVNVPAAGSS